MVRIIRPIWKSTYIVKKRYIPKSLFVYKHKAKIAKAVSCALRERLKTLAKGSIQVHKKTEACLNSIIGRLSGL